MKKTYLLFIFAIIFTLIASSIFGIAKAVLAENTNTNTIKTPTPTIQITPAEIPPTEKIATTTPEIIKIKKTTILHFGDLMLDRNVKKQIDKFGVDYPFTKLAENNFLDGYDLVTANLEGPFADKRRATSKSIAFRFDPKLIPTLQKYHFNLFNLANNHSTDMSMAGFAESKANLKKAGIDFYGQQLKIDDANLLVKQVGGFKIGFIGVDDTITRIDISKVKKLIQKAKDGGAEIILADVHWGAEYKPLSNTRQRELGHTMIDAGVDIIIGHHPHVVEEMEVYKNHPIFYSLGNFVFDQYFSVPTQQELGVALSITQENNQKNVSMTVYPLQSILSQISQMDTKVSEKFFADWIKRSRLGDYKFENNNIKVSF